MRHWSRFGRIVLLLSAAGGCGPPKEAEDPRELLGDDLQGTSETPTEPSDPAERSPSQPAPAKQTPPDPPATRAECRAAAERMVELGLRAARAERGSDAPAADLSAGDRQKIVQQAVDECLAWTTPRSEAQCVARAQEEGDIDRCVPP